MDANKRPKSRTAAGVLWDRTNCTYRKWRLLGVSDHLDRFQLSIDILSQKQWTKHTQLTNSRLQWATIVKNMLIASKQKHSSEGQLAGWRYEDQSSLTIPIIQQSAIQHRQHFIKHQPHQHTHQRFSPNEMCHCSQQHASEGIQWQSSVFRSLRAPLHSHTLRTTQQHIVQTYTI